MPITHEFEYLKPRRLDEAISLLTKYGGKAKVLAGGTDLIVNIKEGLETPEVLIDIKAINELKRLEFTDNQLFVGALITFSELLDSLVVKEKFPLIWETAKQVASISIRNRATMVGNICSAVPSLDSGPALLVYEADVLVEGEKGEKKLPILKWFLGPKKSILQEGELAIGISIPLPKKRHSGCYVKLGRYRGEDLAQVGVALLALEGKEYRVAFCAVGPVPARARKIEALLSGKELTDEIIEEAKKLIPEEISPITDIRATREYRIHMAKIMFERGIRAALSRLKGQGPEYGTELI